MSPATTRSLLDRASWLAMAVVLVVALVVGTGLVRTPPVDAASRIAKLDSELRCPSCVDLSVAESNASTAVAVRNYVAAAVHRGESDAEIIAFMESRYGESILFVPSRSGLGSLIWWIPLGAAVFGLAALVFVFAGRRRSRDHPDKSSAEDEDLVAQALRAGGWE